MDLQATGMLCLGWLILCVADDAWTGIYSVVPGISSSCGGSIVFGVSSSVVSLLLVLMARSIYIIALVGLPLCLELPICHQVVGFFVVFGFHLSPLL